MVGSMGIRRRDMWRYAILLSTGVVLEAAGYPKPGNVHRLRDLSDTRFEDFLVTGLVFVPYLYRGILRGYKGLRGRRIVYGDLIYGIVDTSLKLHGGGNTCLGSSLLLVPLAVSLGNLLRSGDNFTLEELTIAASMDINTYSTPYDAVYFYRAIRRVRPSYIRSSDYTGEYPNVWDKEFTRKLVEKNLRLWDILVYSSERDIVAKEIVEGYVKSKKMVNYLEESLLSGMDWNEAVVRALLILLSYDIDTLIQRKHGADIARKVSEQAREALKLKGEKFWKHVRNLDKEWSDKGYNPGSTADLIVSSISLYAVKHGKSLFRLNKI